MQTKTNRSFRFLSLMLVFVFWGFIASSSLPVRTQADGPGIDGAGTGTAYYVDSLNGNDSHDGTSPSSAWQSLTKINSTTFQPGDTLYFKAGSTWTGQLWPKGSGTADSPIRIDCYGSDGGSLPLIQGAGSVSATVHLENQQYWEISHLEVTNDDDLTVDQEKSSRSAVMITNKDSGALHHLYVHDLYIHDVDGLFSSKSNGGILFTVIGTVAPSWYEDVQIANNRISNIDRSGIRFGDSSWDSRTPSSTKPWTPSIGVVVRNNTLDSIKGDGIVVRVSTKPLVEYNVVSNSNNHSASLSDANVAIWAFDTDDAVIQYNEAYLTQNTHDGEGFDSDYLTHGTVIQYNYSHDNIGGFLLVCSSAAPGTFNDGTVVRYNISQNDGPGYPSEGIDARVMDLSGNITNASIYNNTIYIPSDSHATVIDVGDGWDKKSIYPDHVGIFNNIFADYGSGEYVNVDKMTNSLFDHNDFVGQHPESEPTDAHKLTVDPGFAGANSGLTGRNTVDGYRLQSTSPLYEEANLGLVMSDNGGKDYWGNPVSAASPAVVGAYNGPGVTGSSGTTGNGSGLIAHYGVSRFTASKDATVRGGSYSQMNQSGDTSPDLVTKADAPGYAREAYIGFDFSNFDRSFSKAVLALAVTGTNGYRTENTVALTDYNAWDEDTITWDSKPPSTSVLGTFVATSGQKDTLDVTAEVKAAMAAGKQVAVRVICSSPPGSSRQVTYGSSENPDPEVRPLLILSYDDTPPVTTATVTGSEHNGWYTSDVHVALAATDPDSTVESTVYSLDGGASWMPYSAPFSVTEEGIDKIDYFSTDPAGNQEAVKHLELHVDRTAPTLSVSLDKTELWPVNHKLVPIHATMSANDSGSGVQSVVLQSIVSNELLASASDIEAAFGTSTNDFQLRAERDGGGTGRIYTVTYQAVDQAGNTATQSVQVLVPHDQSHN